MTSAPGERPLYVFPQSEEEHRRLEAQAGFLEPYTRELLRDAGLAPGMRVLDIGCGGGDVALLAARLVGPAGSVVGIDRAPEAVAAATRRAAEQGAGNVSFRQADLEDLDLGGERFDALVGRCVLMYLADPSGALAAAARHLAPGAVVAVQELDFSTLELPRDPWTVPGSPTWERIRAWWREVAQHTGVRMRMGSLLRPIVIEAGLPAPALRMSVPIGGGRDFPGYGWAAGVVASMLPLMERLGVAVGERVDAAELEASMREEVASSGGVMACPALAGALTRVPGGGSAGPPAAG